jgi:SulP family sulfate permease
VECLAERLQASGRHLVLCGMRRQPAELIAQTEFHRQIGAENLQPNLAAALARARELLAPAPEPTRRSA